MMTYNYIVLYFQTFSHSLSNLKIIYLHSNRKRVTLMYIKWEIQYMPGTRQWPPVYHRVTGRASRVTVGKAENHWRETRQVSKNEESWEEKRDQRKSEQSWGRPDNSHRMNHKVPSVDKRKRAQSIIQPISHPRQADYWTWQTFSLPSARVSRKVTHTFNFPRYETYSRMLKYHHTSLFAFSICFNLQNMSITIYVLECNGEWFLFEPI